MYVYIFIGKYITKIEHTKLPTETECVKTVSSFYFYSKYHTQ